MNLYVPETDLGRSRCRTSSKDLTSSSSLGPPWSSTTLIPSSMTSSPASCLSTNFISVKQYNKVVFLSFLQLFCSSLLVDTRCIYGLIICNIFYFENSNRFKNNIPSAYGFTRSKNSSLVSEATSVVWATKSAAQKKSIKAPMPVFYRKDLVLARTKINFNG